MCSNARKTNRFSVFLSLTLVILTISNSCSAVSFSELYPFGRSHGDAQTEPVDDGGSDKIKLKATFKFFGRNKTTLYVNNNGILTFDNKLVDQYRPQAFPTKDNRSIVAPFWADIDTEYVNGTVWFRQTDDQVLLNRVTSEIRSYFFQEQFFKAAWMFIVTWEEVGFYGALHAGRNKWNTFQAVLTTDGVHSFVIFNYNKIVWTTGTNSGGNALTGLGGNPAQAGFNAGDQVHYYSIEGAQTDAVINLTLTSNVDVPGKWVFQVDGDTVQDYLCKNAKSIVLSSSSGDMLGGTKLNITGPCVSSRYAVTARIVETNTSAQCMVVNDETSACVFPPVFRTGELTIEYRPYEGGLIYSALYIVNNVLTRSFEIVRRHPENWIIETVVNCSWNVNLIPSTTFQLDVLSYSDNNGPTLVSVLSFHLSTNDTKNGEFSFVLDKRLGNHSIAIIRLSWNITSKNQIISPVIWSDFFPVRWKEAIQSVSWCSAWIEKERTLTHLLETSSSCPCTLTQAARDVGRYHPDPLCSKDTPYCFYHSTSYCVRRNFNIRTSSGESCCYGVNGELVDIRDDQSGGGNLNRYHYQTQGNNSVPYFSFYKEDVLPYLHCCQYSLNRDMCQTFIKYRPPTTCQLYNPPTPAIAAGDPHMTTLDGLDYTFNGIGDFILMEEGNCSAVIQVRAVRVKDTDGVDQNATVFSAVAMVVGNISDKVEVYRTDSGNARILVNGQEHIMTSPSTSELKDVTISRNKTTANIDSVTIVSEIINLSVSLEVSSDLINILVMIGDTSMNGSVKGLLGNFNGNASDDLLNRNGQVLSPLASLKSIHFNFGMTWQVNQNENLFSDSFEVPLTYQPEFNVNKSFLRNGTAEICQNDPQCIFDYQVTGDENLASSMLAFNEKFQQIKEDIQKVIRCPHLSEPENGNKSVSGYMVGDTALFWCLPGFVMLCSDCLQRTCQADGLWSGSAAVCAEKIVGPEKEILPVIAGSAGGVGIALIAVVIFCICCRRKKPSISESEAPTMLDTISSSDIPTSISVFENEAFIQSLRHMNVGGPYRIPRPSFVDPDLFDEYFF